LKWVQANVSPGTRLAYQIYSLPIVLEGDDMRWAYQISEFFALTEPQRLEQLACQGSRYILTSSFQEDRQQGPSRRGEQSGYEALREHGRVAMTFWPGPGETSVPLNIDDVGLPFWHLTHYTRPGPTISVYELTPKAC
jgi:hypothetical protein